MRGALALALAVRESGCARRLVLPAQSAAEAARVEGVDIRSARNLGEVVQAFLPGDDDVGARELPGPDARAGASTPPPLPDLADVKGQAGARRALEVAAAGAPRPAADRAAGRRQVDARRAPGRACCRRMTPAEALASAALLSVSSQGLDVRRFGQRPVRSPHHSASAVALVGGGSPPRPGEISLAHAGVLFLDELPEFPRSALEALREPLETGQITISRAAYQAQYPARFQLVAAMNPCPCGWLGAFAASGRQCVCSSEAVRRYQARLSGPLLDRIDMQIEVPALRPVGTAAIRRRTSAGRCSAGAGVVGGRRGSRARGARAPDGAPGRAQRACSARPRSRSGLRLTEAVARRCWSRWPTGWAGRPAACIAWPRWRARWRISREWWTSRPSTWPRPSNTGGGCLAAEGVMARAWAAGVLRDPLPASR